MSLLVWHLSFDLSGKGGPTSSKATAGIALRVIGARKPHHYDKTSIVTHKKKMSNGNMSGIKENLSEKQIRMFAVMIT